jgi:hypothetical protein
MKFCEQHQHHYASPTVPEYILKKPLLDISTPHRVPEKATHLSKSKSLEMWGSVKAYFNFQNTCEEFVLTSEIFLCDELFSILRKGV